MSEHMNIQDKFLTECIQKKIPVTLFIMNGFQMRGVLRAEDNFTVVLESDGKQQLIYKHAISTVSPIRPMNCLKNL